MPLKTIISTILLCLSGIASATTIKGKIIDTQGSPIPFVTIFVLSRDSALLTSTITDDKRMNKPKK